MNPDDLNAVGTVIDRDPNTSKKREYTDAIHLVKPKRNEINPSANNIGLADWNSNMDIIDNYIAQILDTIGEITAGSTFLPIPASIPTSGISTNAFCADVLSSSLIQSGVLYTGDATLTDGPAGENVAATMTIRKFGSYVVITANADTDDPSQWYYHYSNSHASTKWLPMGSKGGGGDTSAELTESLTTSIAVGGVPVGTTYAAGTPLEDIIRAMLSPVLYPTLTNPKATLAASGDKIFETGSTHTVNFSLTFSRGSINPAYNTSGYRSGAAIDYTFEGTTKSTGTFSATVTESKTSFTGSVRYAEGEQPKDSNGNNYSTPLPAGSVTSNAIVFEFVDALWGNTFDISTADKQTLVSKSADYYTFNFPAVTEANPEFFDVPASWNVTDILVYNDLTSRWEDCSDTFTKTTTTHENAAGETVNYNRYTCNLGYEMGAREIRIKWN